MKAKARASNAKRDVYVHFIDALGVPRVEHMIYCYNTEDNEPFDLPPEQAQFAIARYGAGKVVCGDVEYEFLPEKENRQHLLAGSAGGVGGSSGSRSSGGLVAGTVRRYYA